MTAITLDPALFGRFAFGVLVVRPARAPGGTGSALRDACAEAVAGVQALASRGDDPFAGALAEIAALRGPGVQPTAADAALSDALKNRVQPPALAADAVAWLVSLVTLTPALALDAGRAGGPLALRPPEPGERARCDEQPIAIAAPLVLADARQALADPQRRYDAARCAADGREFLFALFSGAAGARLDRALDFAGDLCARHLGASPVERIKVGI